MKVIYFFNGTVYFEICTIIDHGYKKLGKEKFIIHVSAYIFVMSRFMTVNTRIINTRFDCQIWVSRNGNAETILPKKLASAIYRVSCP
jgi:hypothetical protein